MSGVDGVWYVGVGFQRSLTTALVMDKIIFDDYMSDSGGFCSPGCHTRGPVNGVDTPGNFS